MSKKRHNSRRSHSGANRPTGDSEDQFVAGVLNFSTWAKQNQRIISIFGVVLVTIVATVVYVVDRRQAKLDEAGARLTALQTSLSMGDPEAAKVGISQYLEEFGDTPYGAEAALTLARLYLDTDQPELALRALDRAEFALGEPMGAQAFLLRGKAQEAVGDLDAAEDTFRAVAQDARMSFERIEGRAQAARVLTTQGEYDEAAELYDAILAGMEPSDPQRGLYEMRLGEVEALALD